MLAHFLFRSFQQISLIDAMTIDNDNKQHSSMLIAQIKYTANELIQYPM